ncbi:MAG: aspartate aminotransferase [Candidatus Edwardsbacteria bacterium RifOxyA12_full_54_48]|uniref:Aminotransferase n=1 Tax=Candidatus Edwardsbacteria bacterium GWF2_54_11 TaxID=1817851 RepID=A0A1F5RJ55_9BACT|nr:MAG: aspartate aminotransferase [Candidatus Edwardsbacteria bacterium RifOxyC12_full_54_24]OGF08482.1 MAG: aspartate aminotransferase [Candidatus Edwardsbacteria bacterium RifOxyA12_full_54_48]OGF11452.1 MAG: aspartate aminotransferase [Candidatus Edwardsbacteria bacterium GWE2_54_12]OGF14404.1 MAG: aspartate aminotransferase [Candidatus Edwardsbacteria bacterium GWF2_54_11]OGJ17942.1 MAG: aspartate aminotransferase [Candidatus Edwardsbacteria bacterium RifOxyB12_full_52_30]HAD81701.1 aspar
MKFAAKMEKLKVETAFEMMAKAKKLEAEGKKIIHLEIGEPDFDTPRNIKEAAKKALDAGQTHYGPSAGLPEHRQAIAQYYSQQIGVQYGPENVVVTPGAKPIMSFAITALLEEGDECLVPDPGFPIYQSMVKFNGGVPVPLPLRESNDFRLDVNELKSKITKKTKLIIINSPHNPTGGILTRDDLKAVADIAVNNNIPVLADEIYDRMIYEGQFESIAQFPGMKDLTIILNGYSKTYAMTGWRVGYGLMPVELVGHMAQLMTNINSCTATFSQIACIEALKGPQDEVTAMMTEFKKRRDFIVDRINRIPKLSCRKPAGAFYIFVNIKQTGMDSRKFTDFLLNDCGICALAGANFGAEGEGYVRFSYANTIENLAEAADRIEKALSRK